MHGFAQAGYASRVTGLRPKDGADFILGEERLQLALAGSVPAGHGGFSAKADLVHDGVANKADVEVREAYLDFSAGPLEARVGRQIVTWGTGDLLFVNDVFPKDWVALFAGRPLEYLKLGSDAIKLDWYIEDFGFEAVVSPFFEADRLPSPERFFVLDPFPEVADRMTRRPRPNFENAESALRVSRAVLGWECALYAHRGFYRNPTTESDSMGASASVLMRFPRRGVYGASAQRAGLGGVVSFEAGYYDSGDDPTGRDPVVPNSQALYLAGYRRQVGRSFTVGLQYYGERMLQYDRYRSGLPAGFPEQDRHRKLVSGRFTWLSNYQTWKLSFFGYWSPTDHDFYLIPEAWHSLADGVWVAMGANVFGGASGTTFFGQLDRNDNVYATLRYEF